MSSKTSNWRGVENPREYARLTNFDFALIFYSGMNWKSYEPLKLIRKKTEFKNFAFECSKGLPPYKVARELNIPEDTAYLWIEKILEMIEISKKE